MFIYLIGLARNKRLQALLVDALLRARERSCRCGTACREFVDARYRTLDSWSKERRVLGKAEVLAIGDKDNPRFVVTNIPPGGIFCAKGKQLVPGDIESLYQEQYCGRGNAENLIKQMSLDLKAERTSSSWMAANQLRIWFSAFAYLLLERVRTIGLAGSALATAMLGSVRLRLLKIAAVVRVSVRRVHVALGSACPLQDVFRQVQRRLANCGPPG